jgi:hypothetical protein
VTKQAKTGRTLMGKRLALIALLLIVGLVVAENILVGAPPFYSAKETRARIVDEHTGQPIEGAVVVAQWVLEVISGRGPTMYIAEAVTDKNGEFVIPGWGPRPRGPITELREKSPQLLIFKHGYWPLDLHNESPEKVVKRIPNYKKLNTKDLQKATAWYEGAPAKYVQESMWNGLNIQLEPFQGTADRWLETLYSFRAAVGLEDENRVPKLFKALAKERGYFKEHPVSKYHESTFVSFFNIVERIRR